MPLETVAVPEVYAFGSLKMILSLLLRGAAGIDAFQL